MLSKKFMAVILVLCCSGAAFAALSYPSSSWVDSSAISVASSYTRYSDMGPGKTIDGSGLSADLKHSKNSWDLWTCYIDDARWGEGPHPPYAYSLSPSGLRNDGWIEYTFSTPQAIDNMWVWNYNDVTYAGRGFKNVAVDYSVDGTTWSRLGGGDTYLQFAIAPGTDGYECNNIISFNGLVVKKVLLTARFADGLYGDPSNGGLSEVQFQVVPEPVTMVLLGLGSLGMMVRKRG